MRPKNVLKVVFATVALTVAAGAPAMASVNVGGGQWSYGTGCCSVWSNYKHASENHSSSADGDYWAYSGCTKPGPWALASAELGGGTGKSYWDKGCKL
ncbi:hypothetical protein GCM10010234_13340 [Streptomyces hawaiiensis]|uniref:lactococcin 972 family bacteriocin n=1 Tax=Streptomyces hawaiiensis TaxID=67305 RepID=UPI0031E1D56A